MAKRHTPILLSSTVDNQQTVGNIQTPVSPDLQSL
jgi:hypothetical protein